AVRLRTGFKSRMAFGGLESPAVCRSRADADANAGGWARDRQTCGDPGLAQRAERSRGLRGNGSRLSKGLQPDLRAGIRSCSLRAPRPLTGLLKPVLALQAADAGEAIERECLDLGRALLAQHAAVDIDARAGEGAGIVAGEKDCSPGDVGSGALAAQWHGRGRCAGALLGRRALS